MRIIKIKEFIKIKENKFSAVMTIKIIKIYIVITKKEFINIHPNKSSFHSESNNVFLVLLFASLKHVNHNLSNDYQNLFYYHLFSR